MRKTLGLIATSAIALALSSPAFAQSSSPTPSTQPETSAQSQSKPQSSASIRQQVKRNLEQAGFTDVRVMPESFLVRAKDKDGNPVMMVINPDSFTAVTAMSGNENQTGAQSEPNSAQQEGQTTSKSAKMTGQQANSGANEQKEASQSTNESAKMGNEPSETVDNHKIPGRPNGMISELKSDEQSGLNLTSTQRAEIWQQLASQTSENAPSGFEPKVGATVPSSLQLKSLPSSISSQVPELQGYDYAMVQSQLLIVDPSSKKIASIISE